MDTINVSEIEKSIKKYKNDLVLINDMDTINISEIEKSIKKYKNGGVIELEVMPDDVKNELNEFESMLSDLDDESEKASIQNAIDNIKQKYPTDYPQDEEIEEVDKTDGSISNLYGGNWFKNNPDKLLGEVVVDKDRYGKEINILKGDISVINKINVDDNFSSFEVSLGCGTTDIKQTITEQISGKKESEDFVENIIKKSESEIGRKAVRKKVAAQEKNNDDYSVPTLNVTPYNEVAKLLNGNISSEELKAYVWYKENIGQRLSNEWYSLAYKEEDSRSKDEMIKDWVKNGVLFYSDGELLPKPIFQSGDIYRKISLLVKSGENSGQDIEYIQTNYGGDVLANHLETINESFKTVYAKKLIITGNSEDNGSLILKPISKFARTFMITSIESVSELKWWASGKKGSVGEPDFEKTDGRSYQQKVFDKLSLTNAFCLWLVINRNKTDIKGNITYSDIIYFYINGRTKQSPSSSSDAEKEIFKAQMQRTKSKAMSEGNRLFLIFLKEELNLNQKVSIEQSWNSSFNNYLKPDFNKIPVAFNITKNFYDEEPFVIRQEKRDAVSFIFNEGSGCLAYDVGIGKSPACLMIIEQFIVAGYSKRPFIVVPNQTYKQWLSEIKNLLPHRKVNGLYNLGVDYSNEVMDENNEVMMVDEGSISVMTYEGFGKLGFNQSTQSELMTNLYEILNQGGADELMSEKKKAGFYEKLETLVGRGLKGTNIEIEKLGFDFISFDEAHALKKVFTSIKGESTDGKKGKKNYSIQSGLPSDTAIKGFMISQYILRNNNYRNVLLLTATPFTNSPLEVFSMLSLVAYHHLSKLGLNNINDFFDNYIDVSTELVINHKLQPQYKQVIKGFNNLASLQRIVLRFFDYKDGEDVGVVRPNKIVIPYVKKMIDGQVVKLSKEEEVTCNIEMSPLQQKFMDAVVKYAEGNGEIESYFTSSVEIEDIEVSEETDSESLTVSTEALDGKEKAGVRALRGMNFSRNIALSPYLFEFGGLSQPSYHDYINTSPKLKYVMECIRSVKEYHEKHNEPMSGQVIYMDRGLKYFGLIKEYLINEVGFKRHEVGEITAKISVENKRKNQDSFLGRVYNEKTKEYESITDEQRIKVILGSSSIKEGMNLQKKSTVLYNCFLDWNPTDIVQLQGRIWRQQNEFMNVRIVNPLMIDSIDIFMFQKLEEKTARLNTIWSNDGKSVLKIEELDPQEVKFALIKNPIVIAKLQSEIGKSKIIDDLSSLKSINDRLENYVHETKNLNSHEEDADELLKPFAPSKIELNIFEKINYLVNVFKQEYPKDESGAIMISSYDRSYNMDGVREKLKDAKMKDVKISNIEAPHKPYWFSSLTEGKRLIDKENKDLLAPRDIKPTVNGAMNYIDKSNHKIKELEKEQKLLESDEYINKKAEEIRMDRIANKYEVKSIEKLVSEFERFNDLLSIKRPKEPKKDKKYVYESCEYFDEKGVRKIDDESIANLTKCVESLPETKELYTNENGEYTEARKELHRQIIEGVKGDVRCIGSKEQPIAILTGGSPASGKSSFLRHYSPFLLNSEILKIDADEIRAKLPDYKGWNSASTHLETKDIIQQLLTDKEIGIPCNFDIIYDGTMNSTKNYLPLIGLLKRLGYQVFIVYMDNVPYKVVKQRLLERYQKNGRFVPISIINNFFSKGKTALDELKSKVDGYMVVDANDRNYNVIEEGGIKLPKDRDYSKISQPFTVKELEGRKQIKKDVEKAFETVSTPTKPSFDDLERRLAIVKKMALKDAALNSRVSIIKKMIKKAEANVFEKGGYTQPIRTVKFLIHNERVVKGEIISEMKVGNETHYFVRVLTDGERIGMKSSMLFNTEEEARSHALKNKMFLLN